MQIDSINELPRSKQPPEMMLWDSASEELDRWIDKTLSGKSPNTANIIIPDSEIEG